MHRRSKKNETKRKGSTWGWIWGSQDKVWGTRKYMRELTEDSFSNVCANSCQCWLSILRLWWYECSSLPSRVGVGTPLQREIYALLSGRQGEGRNLLLLELLILKCLQLKIILISKWCISGWHRLIPLQIRTHFFRVEVCSVRKKWK